MASSIAALGRLRPPTRSTDALIETRARTLALVDGIERRDLERVHSTLMSPLVWDLGHIAAFEDLWLVHRFGGRPLLRDDLADVYDAFETPRAGRGDLPSCARPRRATTSPRSARACAQRDRRSAGVGDGADRTSWCIRHEQQHNETMLQTMQLAPCSIRLGCDRRAAGARRAGRPH